MSKDWLGDLTKLDPFKVGTSKSVPTISTKEITDVFKTGLGFGRKITAWQVKNILKKKGYDPVTIAACVDAAKAGRDYDDILYAADQAAIARAKSDEIRTNPPKIYGSARWSEPNELKAANYMCDQIPETGQGLYLGHAHGSPVYWNGESHLLTVAPTRTGKGTMQIIPNLLRYKGSAVVLDPKGELAMGTAKWRKDNVGPVFILNPFGHSSYKQFTHAVNPLDYVKNAKDATKLAEMIYPRSEDERNRFFDNEAIGFLSGVIEYFALVTPPEARNMGTLRDTVSSLDKPFEELLENMTVDDLPPSIRNAARNVETKTNDVSKPRLIDSISQHLRIWDTPGLRAATDTSDFDFKDLKDKPITVYLILPFDELHTYSTYVQMVFAIALEAMVQRPKKPDIPVLFVLDEFLGLEADSRFVSALRTHAGYGVRLWFFLQDLPTLEQKYRTTWKTFFQSEVKMFFGTDDPNTAKIVSESLGDTTVAYDLPNANPSLSGSGTSYSISENVHITGRSLLKPDEVIRVLASTDPTKPRKSITFLRGVSPVLTEISPWFNDETAKERFNHEA